MSGTLQQLISDGYTLVGNFDDESVALNSAQQLISTFEAETADDWRKHYCGAKVVERNDVPSVPCVKPFQAFHFDGGQVIFPRYDQEVTCFTVLFGREPGVAKTRIISLEGPGWKATDGKLCQLESKLKDYGLRKGSGWIGSHNIYRVSNFCRIIAALCGDDRLTNFNEIHANAWYESSKYGNEFSSVEEESGFLDECGLDVNALAKHQSIKKGDALLIDNLKCVHSRFGARTKNELTQFLFKRECVAVSAVDLYRKWLIARCYQLMN